MSALSFVLFPCSFLFSSVQIYVGKAISITHTRWEQSLHPPASPLHFEVCWEVRLSFDVRLTELKAALMRIQDIKFNEAATDEYKSDIRKALTGNGYII